MEPSAETDAVERLARAMHPGSVAARGTVPPKQMRRARRVLAALSTPPGEEQTCRVCERTLLMHSWPGKDHAFTPGQQDPC